MPGLILMNHGLLNVPIEHHPTIRYMVYNGYNGYYKVMSNSPKMGHLPIPVNPKFSILIDKHLGPVGQLISYSMIGLMKVHQANLGERFHVTAFQNSIYPRHLSMFWDLISDKNPHFRPMPSGFEHGELQIQWFSDDNLVIPSGKLT